MAMIVHLSGCLGLVQTRQMKAKTKKKKEVKVSKIFIPMSKIAIFKFP